ncbi:hypothetical protein D9M68_884640 [compost metagenome]
MGEQVTLVVVEVALVTNAGGLRQAAGGRMVPCGAFVDQVAALGLGAQSHAVGNRGVERTADVFGFEVEPHRQWSHARDGKA